MSLARCWAVPGQHHGDRGCPPGLAPSCPLPRARLKEQSSPGAVESSSSFQHRLQTSLAAWGNHSSSASPEHPAPVLPRGAGPGTGSSPSPEPRLPHGRHSTNSTQISPGGAGIGLPGKGGFHSQIAVFSSQPLWLSRRSEKSHYAPFFFLSLLFCRWGENGYFLFSLPTERGEPFLFFFPSLKPFMQINLWAEAKPGEISSKTMKFSEPNGSNYRGLESKLFRNFNKSRL